jgi:hypothetical protein
VKLLHSLIIFNEKRIFRNSEIVLKRLVFNPENQIRLLFPLRIDMGIGENNEEVQIVYSSREKGKNKQTLKSLKKFAKNKDYDYFLAMMDLVADLCVQRNKKAIVPI